MKKETRKHEATEERSKGRHKENERRKHEPNTANHDNHGASVPANSVANCTYTRKIRESGCTLLQRRWNTVTYTHDPRSKRRRTPIFQPSHSTGHTHTDRPRVNWSLNGGGSQRCTTQDVRKPRCAPFIACTIHHMHIRSSATSCHNAQPAPSPHAPTSSHAHHQHARYETDAFAAPLVEVGFAGTT